MITYNSFTLKWKFTVEILLPLSLQKYCKFMLSRKDKIWKPVSSQASVYSVSNPHKSIPLLRSLLFRFVYSCESQCIYIHYKIHYSQMNFLSHDSNRLLTNELPLQWSTAHKWTSSHSDPLFINVLMNILTKWFSAHKWTPSHSAPLLTNENLITGFCCSNRDS